MAGNGFEQINGVESPGGLRGARGHVLVELKRLQPVTAKELADRMEMSLNAIRHHLKELESDGLIGHERAYRGVGAPAFLYRLSEPGEALFPRRYQQTLDHILDHLIATGGREATVELFEARFREVASRLRGELGDATAAERAEVLSRYLADEGYMPEWQGQSGGEAALVEYNCPIRAVAERFPEICAAEARFLSEVLGASVERKSRMVDGCGTCEYHVRPENLAPRHSDEAGPNEGPREQI